MAKPLILTEKSVIKCNHGGRVNMPASQRFVKIANEAVLTSPDPKAKPISQCPLISSNMVPCTSTAVTAPLAGLSSFVTINGKSIVNDLLDGMTNGTPPGTVHFQCVSVLQTFVFVDPN